MIKRIVTTDDLRIVYENLKDLAKTHPVKHYGGAPFDPETLYAAWNNQNSLINSCVLVANFIDDNTIDAICWYVISKDWRVNKTVATSYLWISRHNKNGIAVFNEALRILKRRRVDIINTGYLLSSKSAPIIEKMLIKRGFIPEDKSYSFIMEK